MSGLKIPELIQAIRRRCAQQYADQNQAETQMRQAMIGNDQRGFDEAVGRQQLAQLTGSILGNLGMALEEAWQASHDDADGPEVEETDGGRSVQ